MFSRLFLIVSTVFLTVMTIFAQAPPLEIGVSQTLAKWRAANYSDVRYKLNLTLEKGAPLMKGDIEIRVNLTEEGAKNDLILDWRTTQFASDKDKPFVKVFAVNRYDLTFGSRNFSDSLRDEHLIISSPHFVKGENVIKIEFASPIKTSGAAITRYIDKEDGAEYVYSLFVPSDASTAFPVFDQPDLKARFQLNLVIPIEWEAISNTTPKISDGVIETHRVIGDRKDHIIETLAYNELVFPETKPISTYVFAFAAGDFDEFVEGYNEPTKKLPLDNWSDEEVNKVLDPKKQRVWVRKSQTEKFKQHAAEVFRLNREGVKFLESYFDYKFPFPKYDLVLLPEFPFGGMEHAGATYLREDRVIFPTEPTKNDYITRANLIFHEAAHQWFGDTVTMRWFDDLWLKEGFAEFMAYKTLERVMPEYNAWKIFYERNKQAAYLTDSTRGTTPIYQAIPNLSAAKSAYGNIVYRKAPSFLKQAEFYLGADKFQTAVRAFLKKHEFANAEWTDLIFEFNKANCNNSTNRGVWQFYPDWTDNWVKKRGLPIFRTSLSNENLINQSNALEENTFWQEKTKVLTIKKDGSRNTSEVLLDNKFSNILKAKSLISAKLESEKDVQFIFPNYQDYGYGIFLLDERSRAYVLANVQTETDDFLRTMMWGALWDSVRETELAPRDYVELVIKNISVEQDESTIQTLLGRVSTAMNYYLSDKQRDELAEKVENLLIEQMTSARTKGQRITFYRAFLNIASTKKAAQVLRDILEANNKATPKEIEAAQKSSNKDNKKLEFAGLPVLSTKDKFDVVTKLLILNDKDAPQILTELEKSETSDEAKRYAYAARAGVATTENAAKFFNDFVNNKDISESYIESAFVPFNAPRRADLTLPYLEKALAELPNLKRNRKIFFVNGWLAAFIGGQKSEQALQIVNKFLADNPNLDKDLRLKILENADGLERAVKIRAKYGK